MADSSWSIRPAAAQDGGFLADMLIAAAAAGAGIERISLSVERKNFAGGLYRSEGYVVVDDSDPQSDIMVKSLANGRPPA